MNHNQQPSEAFGLPVHGTHAEPALPPGFIPMRLVLQPSGAIIEVNRPDTLVGRHTEADIRLPLPDVSRRHCRLVCGEGGWQVIDLNSLNGVAVNGESVLQAPLHDGDVIRIGGFTFAVDLAGQSQGPAISSTGGGQVQSIAQTLGGLRQAS